MRILPPDASTIQPRRLVTSRGPFAVLDVAGAGPPRPSALLVPGYTGSKEDFLAVLPGLAAAGHRVVAADLRGQYETPGPDEPAAYAIAELAADVHAIIRALRDGPVHLVGHSFGGLVCRHAVIDEPRAVRSLTLLASGPAAISGQRARAIRLMAPVLADGGLPAVWAAMAELDGGAAPAPEVTEFLRLRFHASSPVALEAMGAALLAEPDRTADLAATGLPLLVAHGDADDAWSPAEQADMAVRLGARHDVIPGAAHSPAVEAPQATVGTLLRFWRSADGVPR